MGDYFGLCRIGGVEASYFSDMLKSEGITLESRVGLTATLLSGDAPKESAEKLLQALLAVCNEREADPEVFKLYMANERLRLKLSKNSRQARLAAIDSIMCPDYKYSWMKSQGKLTPSFEAKADAFAALDEEYGSAISDSEFTLSASFDCKARGDYFEFVEAKVKLTTNAATGNYIDMALRYDTIFDNDGKVAGFKFDADGDITSKFYEYDYVTCEEVAVVENVKIDCKATLDFTQVNNVGADVLAFDLFVKQSEDGEEYNSVTSNASIKALGNDDFNFAFNANVNDEVVSASGTLEYDEAADNLPSIPAAVIEAKDNALLNNYWNDNFLPGYDW
jgi:hypothetical protein